MTGTRHTASNLQPSNLCSNTYKSLPGIQVYIHFSVKFSKLIISKFMKFYQFMCIFTTDITFL